MRLFRGPASVPILGQLYTGADQTLINKEIADALFVDWKSGTKSFTIWLSLFADLQLEFEQTRSPQFGPHIVHTGGRQAVAATHYNDFSRL